MKDTRKADKTPPGDFVTAPPLKGLASDVQALGDAITRLRAERAADLGLKSSEVAVVGLLHSVDESTVSEIAGALVLQTSTVSKIVSGLVDRRLVSRRRPREDRRVVLLKLTNEGDSLGEELLRETQAYERMLARDIDPKDLETCLLTLKRMVCNQIGWKKSSGASVRGRKQ